MLGLAHPVRSDFLSGLRPRNFLPVTRKIRLLDFKMRQCVGYVRPTIFEVQLENVRSLRIEMNEELQQTKRDCR